jgi:hypothetical protein
MSIQRRYFRITGSLIPLAEQWREAVVEWNARLKAFLGRWGTEGYRYCGGAVVGIVLPEGSEAPPGWRTYKKYPPNVLFPDMKTKLGRELDAEMSRLRHPEPRGLYDAVGAEEVCVTDDGKMYLCRPSLRRIDGTYYLDVPAKDFSPHPELEELKHWEWCKLVEEADERKAAASNEVAAA